MTQSSLLMPLLRAELFEDKKAGFDYQKWLAKDLRQFVQELPNHNWLLSDWLQQWALDEERNSVNVSAITEHDVALAFVRSSMAFIDADTHQSSILNLLNLNAQKATIIGTLASLPFPSLSSSWFQYSLSMSQPKSLEEARTAIAFYTCEEQDKWYVLNQAAQLWLVTRFGANIDTGKGTHPYLYDTNSDKTVSRFLNY